MSFRLETIKDFDFGVGPSADVVRVSEVPGDVSSTEVNLILWLILEHEFGTQDSSKPKAPLKPSRTQFDGGSIRKSKSQLEQGQGDTSSFVDHVDSSSVVRPSVLEGQGGVAVDVSRKSQRKSFSQIQKARKYAEQLLREAGVNLPFDQLSLRERRDLFQQFSASSELLREQKFGSVLELFHALRIRSKFREDFDILQRIGKGNYGDVFAVTHRQNRFDYAAKRISLTLNNIEELRMTLNESSILKTLIGHPNIVHCHDAWLEMEYDPHQPDSQEDEQEPLKFYVLMDFCFQSLNQWIQDVRRKPEETLTLNILKQIVDGLEYIHSNGVLHLDINTNNILWADNMQSRIKIGDFGLAIKGLCFYDKTGTIPYSAPEAIQTAKSDIYSLGVTIFEVSENISTVNELYNRLTVNEIMTDSALLNGLISNLLDQEPTRRPSASHLKQMLGTLP